MDIIFDTLQAANYLHLAPVTLERFRLNGNGPSFCKLGRSVRYRKVDVDEWLASRVVRSTSEARNG